MQIKVQKVQQTGTAKRRRARQPRKPQIVELTKADLMTDIMREARVLGLEPGSAQLFADKVASKVATWGKRRSAITTDDLNRKLGEELEPYNFDLAYIFKNRDKII